ncbi:MAG TPA: cyclic-di-AMP receptor, partial [Anaerolineales bacterium]|nr:cyclic-di-AMP receptor [Anaerolineales bacterium]
LRTEVVHEILHNDRSVEVAELNRAFEEILRAQRSAYSDLFSSGVISEENFSLLVSEVDTALLNQDISFGDLLLKRSKEQPPITKLIFAAIAQEDVFDVLHMLGLMGIPTTRLSSSSGPDGQPSTTILMGIEESQVEPVVEALIETAKQEPEFQRGMTDLLPIGSNEEEIVVNDAHVFVFNVEHFEEI